MSCNVLIGQWASGVWQDLGSPASVSALTISGYAVSPNTLGRLNNFIGTCYSGSGYSGIGSNDFDVVPDLTDQELAIEGQLYLVSYYNALAQSVMGAGATLSPAQGGLQWQQLREGDSVVTRPNLAAIAKVYTDASKEAMAQLKYLVNVYITQVQGSATPRNVLYLNPPVYGGAWV